MKLKRLSLKNIRSYEDFAVEFPDGSLLLSGDIGSGKTSVLLAIEYALFGLQPGQPGAALLRNEESTGEVNLDIEIDGKTITIERKMKRSSKSITSEYSAITIDGVKKEYSTTELKLLILKILNYPVEFLKKNNLLYRYTVYTPQEQMKNIVLDDPEMRLNIIRHIFGIDKYKNIRSNTSIIISKLKDESKSLQGEIKGLEEDYLRIEAKKKDTQEIERKIQMLLEEREKIIKNRESLEESLHNLENKIKEKEKLEYELDKTRVIASSKKEQFNMLTKEILDLDKSIKETAQVEDAALIEVGDKLKNTKNSLSNHEQKLTYLTGQTKEIDERVHNIIRKKESIFTMEVCPVCLQNVSNSYKHNILISSEQEITELSKRAGEMKKESVLLNEIISKEKPRVLELEREKSDLEINKAKSEHIINSKKKLAELMKIKESGEKDVDMLMHHLNKLKEDILRLSPFDLQHKLKKEELRSSANLEKQADISIAEYKKEIELIKKEKEFLEESTKEKEALRRRLTGILELSDWLSNQFMNIVSVTEQNIMIKIRREFSKRFSNWFCMLAGDSFNIQLDETFTPLLIQNESEMDYSFISGGERTAVALAYRLALNQTINSIFSKIQTQDIIILDEPTEGFSENQLDKMRNILHEIKIKQLIIVSHEQKMEGFVDNIIKIKKQNGISFIEK